MFSRFMLVVALLATVQLAKAAVVHATAVHWQWELFMLLGVVGVAFSAWIGASIPPPREFATTAKWSYRSRFGSSVIVGYCVLMYMADNAPISLRMIAAACVTAMSGAAVPVLVRAIVIKFFRKYLK